MCGVVGWDESIKFKNWATSLRRFSGHFFNKERFSGTFSEELFSQRLFLSDLFSRDFYQGIFFHGTFFPETFFTSLSNLSRTFELVPRVPSIKGSDFLLLIFPGIFEIGISALTFNYLY